MTNRSVIGIVVLVLQIAGLIVWGIQTRATATEVGAAVRPLPVLPVEVIGPDTRDGLSRRELHGSVPVAPAPAEPARDNPFE